MGDIKDFFIFIICHSWHSLFFYIKYLDVANCDIKNLHCRHYQKAWPLYPHGTEKKTSSLIWQQLVAKFTSSNCATGCCIIARC